MPDKKLFIYSPGLEEGGYPKGCPFDSSRSGLALKTAASMGLLNGDDREVAAIERPSREVLEGFHEPAYLDALKAAGEGTLDPRAALGYGLGTPDCPMWPRMWDYLELAAGGPWTGARRILAGDAVTAFAPSGGLHHARPAAAAGFSYLNDLVLAIREFTGAGKRVFYIDIDVHHGDGVQEAFYDRSDVLTFSMHESGRTLFPGSGSEDEIGEGEGRGYSVNVPLPVGTHDKAWLGVIDEVVLPLAHAFDPDAIVCELGMDTLAGDPLAHLHLTNNAPAGAIEKIVALGKPLVVTGGGGYHVENTVRGWALCWGVMCGDQAEADLVAFGMGGVMMENTDWFGGLRDRVLLSDAGRRGEVDAEIARVVTALKRTVFPIHGLA